MPIYPVNFYSKKKKANQQITFQPPWRHFSDFHSILLPLFRVCTALPNRISLNVTQLSELHKSASMAVVLIIKDPPTPRPPSKASLLFRRTAWFGVNAVERSHLCCRNVFPSYLTAKGHVAFWSPLAASVRRPVIPFYQNGLHYGSRSKFDADGLRWRERRAIARHHTLDYSHANLATRSLELMETNVDKKSLPSRDGCSHAIRLCHCGQTAFSSSSHFYSEAADEKRRAKSTQSQKIAPLRPW